jgi:hypothetical protein
MKVSSYLVIVYLHKMVVLNESQNFDIAFDRLMEIEA